MNVFNDVFTEDSDINPKDVICSEPLRTPLGNCSDELIIPLPTVSYEPVAFDSCVILVSNEDVVDSKLDILISFDAVYEFKDVISV